MTASTTTQIAAVAAGAAQAASKAGRFSFGPVWNQAVVDGDAKYLGKFRAKLEAQAVELKLAGPAAVKTMKLETLIAKVGEKLTADITAAFETPVSGAAAVTETMEAAAPAATTETTETAAA